LESPLHETAGPDLKVIETLRYAGGEGFVRLDLHLARAARTCARLRFPFREQDFRAQLAAAVGDDPARCRVTVDRAGVIAVETAPLTEVREPWRISPAAERLASNDAWLALKTTRRDVYDRARAAMPKGADEVFFMNETGALCEGSITNIFVPADGTLLTPAQACGLLPGVLRQALLESGRAREAFLTPTDLEGPDGFYVGNSLRGLIRAKLF
jgi:4-amino-4-deoxychorismate lyase